MEDDLTTLRAALPDFAGYGTLDARRLADAQVRAYVGETLAALRAGGLPADLAARCDGLVLRCEFGDQTVIRAIESARSDAPGYGAELAAADRALVDLAAAAAAARTLDAAALDGIEAAFGRREATIERPVTGS